MSCVKGLFLDKNQRDLLLAGLAKAEQKLASAKDNVKLGHFDDGVSRAYYAALTSARTLLLSEGMEPKSHDGVWTLMALHFVKTGKFPKELVRDAQDLKADRESGDYDFFSAITSDEAKESIEIASKFLAEVKTHLESFLKWPRI